MIKRCPISLNRITDKALSFRQGANTNLWVLYKHALEGCSIPSNVSLCSGSRRRRKIQKLW